MLNFIKILTKKGIIKYFDACVAHYRTLYNRAILYKNIHDFDNALADITKVIEVLPDFPVAHFVRSEIYKEMGQERKANQEYDKSIAMVKRLAYSEKIAFKMVDVINVVIKVCKPFIVILKGHLTTQRLLRIFT